MTYARQSPHGRTIKAKTPEAQKWLDSLENVERSFSIPERFLSDLEKHFCYVGRKPKDWDC